MYSECNRYLNLSINSKCKSMIILHIEKTSVDNVILKFARFIAILKLKHYKTSYLLLQIESYKKIYLKKEKIMVL